MSLESLVYEVLQEYREDGAVFPASLSFLLDKLGIKYMDTDSLEILVNKEIEKRRHGKTVKGLYIGIHLKSGWMINLYLYDDGTVSYEIDHGAYSPCGCDCGGC